MKCARVYGENQSWPAGGGLQSEEEKITKQTTRLNCLNDSLRKADIDLMKFVQVELPYVAIQYGGPICACAQQTWRLQSGTEAVKVSNIVKKGQRISILRFYGVIFPRCLKQNTIFWKI